MTRRAQKFMLPRIVSPRNAKRRLVFNRKAREGSQRTFHLFSIKILPVMPFAKGKSCKSLALNAWQSGANQPHECQRHDLFEFRASYKSPFQGSCLNNRSTNPKLHLWLLRVTPLALYRYCYRGSCPHETEKGGWFSTAKHAKVRKGHFICSQSKSSQ
jgi:hypothetical protein